MAELEGLEAEISRLTGLADQGEEDAEAFRAGERFEGGRVWRAEPQDIKSLYREVAKTVHPDLAGAGPGELYRNEMMLKANRAYAAKDSSALREILQSWRRAYAPAGWDEESAELARLLREIATERKELRELSAELEELRNGYAFRLRLRQEAGYHTGSDLFSEMVAAVEFNIARARKRLAALKGEPVWEGATPRTVPVRKLNFPEEFCCGTLYLRERDSADCSRWRTFGPAVGCIEVGGDQAVRLDVKGEAGRKLGYLQRLKPDDLQSLYLYDACDSDLDSIPPLTGLEELYLSGARLTDGALTAISTLTKLTRIYLYQTAISDLGLIQLQGLPGLRGLTSSGNSITDQGLARFQRVAPRVKTVSFQWRR